MKKLFFVVALFAASPVMAHEDMSNAEYFARAATGVWSGPIPTGGFGGKQLAFTDTKDVPHFKREIADRIVERVRSELGDKWVKPALKIAKLESGYNCRAVGPRTSFGHAKGLFQLIDPSARALGFDPRDMLDCDKNISAGIAHMRKCIEHGVQTEREMASCHVSGWGNWNVRLARRSEKYRREYIRLAMR